jgi:hypothetical protein
VHDHFLPSGLVPIHFLALVHCAPAASQLVPVFPELRLSLQYACILAQSALMHLPMAFCAELGTAVKIKAARTAEQ